MNKPLIWGHRGASGYAPENTLPAFRLAAEMGADGVELDVQLTADGEVVVCHDEKVDRTSDGAGRVKDLTLAELKRMDFSAGKSAFAGVCIPTLAEVLDLLEPTGLTVNIELKTGIYFYPGIAEKVLSLVHGRKWERRVLYSSFNHETLRTIRRLDPGARTGVLYADGLVDVVPYARMLGASALHPVLYNLQYPGFLEACRKGGMDINVWTVNEEADLRTCMDLGLHAVITNYPDRAADVFARESC